MSLIKGWDGTTTSTADYDPYSYQQPPSPSPYNPTGNPYQTRGSAIGGWGPFVQGLNYPGWNTYGWNTSDDKDEDKSRSIADEIGYPTDWKYPNWLIRMGQWRNF